MKSKEINVLSIAKYLVEKCKINDSIKIHKLIYFIYLKYLKDKKKKLFNDEFEAWIYGPVLRKIHNHIYNNGFDFSNFIDIEELVDEKLYKKEEIIEDIKDEEIIFVINKVVERFKGLSSFEIVDISHKTVPWIKARNNLPHLKPSKEKLKFNEMRKFVKTWELI